MGCRAYYLIAGPATEREHERERDQSDVVIRLYTHWYGHPGDALTVLQHACEAVARIEKDAFTKLFTAIHGSSPLVAECMVGLVLHHGTTIDGMSIRLDGDVTSSCFAVDDERLFGHQCDLEWVYAVDLASKAIWVFGGENRWRRSRELVELGTTDLTRPERFSRSVEEDGFTVDLARPLERIAATGFRVNPAEGFRLGVASR